jgi:hypothetical protein
MSVLARLDELGKPAWLGLLVLSFIIAWPLGLALLAYLMWSGRMGCWKHAGASRWREGLQARGRWYRMQQSSGNKAFDEYRDETLRRLEEEEREFREFLDRLRHAKDKVEFDQFMAQRAGRPEASAS